MSPPAAKRDELVTVLLERLDRFEAALATMRETLIRMEGAEEQARQAASQAVTRLDDHEARLAALEASKHRAEGAATTARLLWAGVVALAGVVGFAAHYVLR